MNPKKLPFQTFLRSFKYAPRVAVNLLIEQDIEVSQTSANVKFAKLNSKAVLLTKRKRLPFAGYWHLPGSFVLKGEALMNCVKRVAKEELGIKVENVKLAEAFDDLTGDPRGHVVDLVYRCTIKPDQKGQAFPGKAWPSKPADDTAEIKFFKKLPQNIGFNHLDTLYTLGHR
ncbi:NUDIX hydrolase [Candidatus Collierbacteria bacterium]|nr:NUDIX hydrolase [Candidatus Collierbacteria bacterium]